MGNKRKRFVISGGIIAIVMIVALALLGSNGAAKSMTIAEALNDSAKGQRVQVTGNVVADSFTFTQENLTFFLEDFNNPGKTLEVVYDKGVSATFGNGVTAICTGTINDSGVLQCSELVTKCPSKYERSTDALSVSALFGYGEAIYSKTVKVTGSLQEGTLVGAQEEIRFVLIDEQSVETKAKPESKKDSQMVLPVKYVGALSDEIKDGSLLVITGSLGENGVFNATDVALEG